MTLSDYSKAAIERLKQRGRSKARDAVEASTSSLLKAPHWTSFLTEFLTQLTSSGMMSLQPTTKYSQTAHAPAKLSSSTHGDYITSTSSHSNTCEVDPNSSKELFNNRVRQVYNLLINNDPSGVVT